uniref:Zona pellucida-binding protein 2 isoform X5 n=1 Tax=Geotrypetes seraphini TaxID=260995 RepID=A0A6P8PCP3_GEOSA|nr:zona pellucida-binding protein 2 isoform X5 [Geotrypetes seraphini]
MRPLAGLGLLLTVLLFGGAMMTNGPKANRQYIYGKLNEKVNVYVKMYKSSPFLACLDESLSQEEIIDPFFLWIGPDGRNLKAYRDPDYIFQVSARFSTQACNTLEDDQYLEELKKVIEDLIFSLHCELTDEFLKCHVIKVPKHGLQNVLFTSFKVNPFAPGWETVCRNLTIDCGDETNSRILQARDRIEEFFLKQTYAQKKEFNLVPPINYVEKSLQISHDDKCRPGFGKDEFTHAECLDCCVVCGPGTYNSNNDVHCRVCSSIQIKYYGATAC